MPVIIAEKDGTCTARGCGGRISRGEYVWFEQATGTRHIEAACRAAPAGWRPNRRAAPCARCGRNVPPMQGHLIVKERAQRKTYIVTCALPCAVRPSPRGR